MGLLTPSVQYQRAPQTQITDNALVENRITGLLSSDNPYMQQATTRGNQQAQSRGLLSSSMAVGAVEGQRIAAALPIAQQDAQTYSNRDLQQGAYDQQASLNDQGYQQQFGLNDQNYNNQRGLNTQNFGFNTQLADQGFGHQTQLNNQTFGQNQQLNRDQFGYQTQLSNQAFGQNTQLNAQQNAAQMQINQQQFGYNSSLNAQQNAANAQLQQDNQVATQRLQLMNNVNSIMANPNLSEEQRSAQIQSAISIGNSVATVTRIGGDIEETSYTYPDTGEDTPNPATPSGSSVPTTANGQPTVVNSAAERWFPVPSGQKWLYVEGKWRLVGEDVGR